MAAHQLSNLLLVIVAICLSLIHNAAGQGGWRQGRASFYGLDGWSIHRGSCGFGYQWPDIGTGFDVAALADAAPEFSGSCGRCFEVKCDPKTVTDGYGEKIDRNSMCRNPDWTVVVRTVDNCPCNYPGNPYSNKRWCCGDNGYTHFDLSIWAFEKLADTKWGVIGLKYRPVPCTQLASNPAPLLPNPSPGEAPPPGASHPNGYTYVLRDDPTGAPQRAVRKVFDPSQSGGAAQVPYESLFEGGGAYQINPLGTDNQFAASKMLGRPFVGDVAVSSSNSRFETGMVVSSFDGSSDGPACDDVPVGGHSCQQQQEWGKCAESFLVDGGYCRKTCGRCSAPDTAPGTNSRAASGDGGSASAGTYQGDSGAGGGSSAGRGGRGNGAQGVAAFDQSSSNDSSNDSNGDWSARNGDGYASNGDATPSNGVGYIASDSTDAENGGSGSGGAPSPGTVYYQGFQNGWNSWSYGSSFDPQATQGVNGDAAICGQIHQYGGFQPGHPGASNNAAGKTALQLWVDNPEKLSINLGSQAAVCTAKPLKDLDVATQQSEYAKFYIPISSFSCPFGSDQITRIIIDSAEQSTIDACFSDIQFV